MLDVSISSFSYAENEILKKIAFQLRPGEHLAVLGESGCGKSTLLHLVYGLLDLPNGHISWKGKKLLGPKYNLVPGEDFIKLVAQEFNLMPFTTVAENIATFLPRMDLQDDASRVSELLDVVDLNDHKDSYVKNLSGGQKQRVALAKALAKQPELLLLDEPFSHIDTFRKNTLRRKLFSYLKEKNISCITATHDSEEALAFSDQMVLLKDGEVELSGTPEEVYQNLNSAYQAGFFGEITVLPEGVVSKKLNVLLPHQLVVSEAKTSLNVTVVRSYFKGNHYLIKSVWNSQDVYFISSEKLSVGKEVYLDLKP